MITIKETTEWRVPVQNHQYIVSDDKRLLYGYIKNGEKYPSLFSKPIRFDPRGRTFQTIVKSRGSP